MIPSPKTVVFVVAVGLFALYGVLFGVYVGDHTAKAWLLSLGGAGEFVGILLVASPELELILVRGSEAAHQAWARILGAARRAWYAVLRRFGKGRPRIIKPVGIAGTSEVGASLGLEVKPSEGASVEERIDFLLRRVDDLQQGLDGLTEQVAQHPVRWQRDIEERADQLSKEQRRGLDELRLKHFRPRLAGLVFLVIGVFLSTFGNLL